MSEYQHNESEAIQRIKPKINDPRYYYLRELHRLVNRGFAFINPSKDATILDYGCGAMPYKKSLQKYSTSYFGADLKENDLADVLVFNTGQIQNKNVTYDIIISTQVLEHVPDYEYYLSEAKRCLDEEGYLVLTTHGYWMYHPDPLDYWRWTSSGLQKIIKDAGFEIVHFEGIIGRTAMGIQLFQDGLMFKLPKIIKIPFIMMCQALIKIFDKINNENQKKEDACTYLVIAKHA